MNKNRNIYLVGLMGSGKTTIGRQLAKQLERVFMDSDHEIESRTGVSISTIFEIEGEAGFRRRESRMIDELSRKTPIVLATGGGTVLNAESRRILRESGWVAYLDVPLNILAARTSHDRNRPLLQVENPCKVLETLHTERDPLYRETAHFVVGNGQLSSLALVQLLIREFSKQCVP